MNSAIERLLTLKVADVMTRMVAQLSPQQAMADAADLLVQREATGAPVVDDDGRCVGVLSATDFMRMNCQSNCREARGGLAIETERVTDHMTETVHSTHEDSSLLDAARMMCDLHVHRLLVLDETGRLLGVVSSLDIAAAVINAIEE